MTVTSYEVTPRTANEVLALRKNPKRIRGIPTGIASLDNMLLGIRKDDLVLFAADTGAGKSAALGIIALNVARWLRDTGQTDKWVGLIHYEMTLETFTERMLSCISGVSSDAVADGSATDDEVRQWRKAVNELSQLPIRYLECPERIDDVIEWVSDTSNGTCALWGLDHLQAADPGNGADPSDPSIAGATARKLYQRLARNAGFPGILLGQLTGEVSKRDDHRPTIGDVYGGTKVKQSATRIVLWYRPDKYNKEPVADKYAPRTVYLFVEKNRHGSDPQQAKLHITLHLSRVEEAA